MYKWLRAVLFSVTALMVAAPCVWAAEAEAEQTRPPVIAIGIDVRTPQGAPRVFMNPDQTPAPWNQTFPVVQGDKVRIAAAIDCKGKSLGAARLRLDNVVLVDDAKGPWQVEVDSGGLVPGHHLVEVWAELKAPDSGFRSATTTFLVVPQNDPLLQVLLPDLAAARAALPKVSEVKLTSTLSSANPKVAEALRAGGPVPLEQRALLEVKAAKPATVYVYALSRAGRVTYVSPSLDLLTYVELVPRSVDPAGGLMAGTVDLMVWAGDGAGHFGPPSSVSLLVR